MSELKPPLLGGALVELLSDISELPPMAHEALRRFMRLVPADRLTITPHVYAYYRDIRNHADGEWLDGAMGVPEQPEEIWNYVRPLSIVIKPWPPRTEPMGGTDPVFYVILEANCDWEDEHGLQIVWKGGHELVKVGPFDDKPRHSEGVQPGVVYHSSFDVRFSTFQTS